MIGIITPGGSLRGGRRSRRQFVRNNAVAAMGGDTAAAVVGQLAGFNQSTGRR